MEIISRRITNDYVPWEFYVVIHLPSRPEKCIYTSIKACHYNSFILTSISSDTHSAMSGKQITLLTAGTPNGETRARLTCLRLINYNVRISHFGRFGGIGSFLYAWSSDSMPDNINLLSQMISKRSLLPIKNKRLNGF